MDLAFIGRMNRGLFRFLCDRYWRIETRGLEHLPRSGPVVLVGAHRGFVPWDGMMTLHLIARETGRIPRFLVHPGLLKFAPIASIIRKLGGVLACRENAEAVLERGEILGVFPEGVQGAFEPTRTAYQLQNFGRNTFVSLASRYGAPIVPLVTIGSAEVYPIFGNIQSRRWKRFAKWPSIPITTALFFPVPLPVKWHTEFLPPTDVALGASIKDVAGQVRDQMQRAMDEIVRKRRSRFWGNVFA